MKILIINGPNLNLLGIREPDIYGKESYEDLEYYISRYAQKQNIDILMFQSNHEGEILDFIHEHYLIVDGIIINAAAYTHTSVAIYDALKAVSLPTVEVHLSDVNNREAFRQVNMIKDACIHSISNHGFEGYIMALKHLEQYLSC